jgi:tRNA-dihydrouridine synthase B
MHPRFGAQGFTGHADWSHLKTLKANVSLPVIASGDLFQAEDGLRCVEQTGVDSIMFARGALSDPSIFSRYLRLRQAQEPEEKSCLRITAMVRRLSELYAEHGMERLGLLKMRTLVPRFLKGLPGARAFRRDIVFCKSWDEVFHILENEISGLEEN